MLAVVAALGLTTPPASAQQATYGTLSNFDVFNDTGEETHGFEIELEDLSSADVTYTFGGTYIRYGKPRVIDGVGRVLIRYESPYDPARGVFTQATPKAPAVVTPTNGHACWSGGSGTYATSGCEHFGVGIRRNPTATVYRWLVADPASPGQLRALGTKVSIPAPVWNVAPPAAPGAAPVVRAVLPAEPPEVHAQWGEAVWVKVFVTESETPAELDRLLTDDPAVPQAEVETEMEWKLLQARPNGVANELLNEGKVGHGTKSVTRRYEFYKYTGAYDPESHEAMCGDGSCDVPLEGELGNYIGAQMAAINLVEPAPALALAAALPAGEVGVAYSAPLVTDGTPPYSIRIVKGALPAGLAIDPASGMVTGTPTAFTPQPVTVKVKVTDQDGASVKDLVTIKIARHVRIQTGALKAGAVDQPYTAQLSKIGGRAPYRWALPGGGLPVGLTFDRATGAISGAPVMRGSYDLTFRVIDGLGGRHQKSLTLTIE
jgi:hypothetical protein